jgi:glycosyltransferase involved in cell wall biosynthesis
MRSGTLIIWLAHEGSLSGANICLVEYMLTLKEVGFNQQLIVPSDGQLAKRTRSLGISVTIVPFYSWTSSANVRIRATARVKKYVRNAFAIATIKKIIQRTKPDFVATNTVTIPVGAFAAKNTSARHIWFVHEFGEEDHGFTINGRFEKGAEVINKLSHKVVFNSLATEKKFAKYVPELKRAIVYNAVGIPAQIQTTERQKDVFHLVMLGQVAPSKNHLQAIKALKICADLNYKVALTIVGRNEDVSYLNMLKEEVAALEISKLVSFKGETSEPHLALLQHDALLMCSKMEAFGRVTVEALKCGLPVIAANSGGSVEIVRDGENGFLYDAKSSKSLAEKIMKMIGNYNQFDRKLIAKRTNETYNEDATRHQLLSVFTK